MTVVRGGPKRSTAIAKATAAKAAAAESECRARNTAFLVLVTRRRTCDRTGKSQQHAAGQMKPDNAQKRKKVFGGKYYLGSRQLDLISRDDYRDKDRDQQHSDLSKREEERLEDRICQHTCCGGDYRAPEQLRMPIVICKIQAFHW